MTYLHRHVFHTVAYRVSPIIFFISITIAGIYKPAIAADVPQLHFSVVAPGPDHFSMSAARQLAKNAKQTNIDITVEIAVKSNQALVSRTESANINPDFLLLPLRSLATQVPALEILELPFFYTGLEQVHTILDGPLGKLLRARVRDKQWEILAFWDEGMQVMSGNRRYNDRINLTGMEFILPRTDPVAEKQFKAFDAWTRSSRPQSREQLLRECRISSRAATLQQIWYERLDRVQQDVSLTQHRYEAWLVVSPLNSWNKLSANTKIKIQAVFAQTLPWQRQDAKKREQDALEKLKTSGMIVHELNKKQTIEFRRHLPAWPMLLSDTLDEDIKKQLLRTAKQQ